MAHTNTFTACYNCPSRQQNLPAPILANDTNLLAPLRKISNCNTAFIYHDTSPKISVFNIHQYTQKLCEIFSQDHKAQRVQPVFKSWQ
jgi:ABC-type oligopeptide transport system ATPase subunit